MWLTSVSTDLDHNHTRAPRLGAKVPARQPMVTGSLCVASSQQRRDTRDGVADEEALTLQLWALAHGLTTLELQETLGPPDEAVTHWREAFESAAVGARTHRGA
jgi:hypothetical protein